jgi:16S rRNA (guanine527-N7)-methyltransferase
VIEVNQRPTGTRLGQSGFTSLTNVSRETSERLGQYVSLLIRWNARINLVGANTLGDVWRRHILDSAQLLPLLPANTQTLIDLGSGAGLPGLILAIMGVPDVHLVESDQRKAAFLREAIRITNSRVSLHVQRAEKLGPFVADAIVARACAPLPELLGYAAPFIGVHSVCLFLKGAQVEPELIAALKDWTMTPQIIPSRTDPTGRILRLEGVARAR